jgi:UDP-glucose 6-dehydrogenase
MLKAGRCPNNEPGLDDLMTRNTRAGRLRFSAHLASALKPANI